MKDQRQIIRPRSAGSIIAICLLAFGLHQACADERGNPGQLTAKDYKFASAAADGGRMEVTLGLMAVQKASATAVRDFGQLMVDEHQKANTELTKLLTQKGATVPDAATKKDDKLTSHLQGLSGPEFDAAYIKAMIKDHKKDVKEFQEAALKSDDSDLKAWAAKTLPMVQEHLRRAQNIEKPATVASARTTSQ